MSVIQVWSRIFDFYADVDGSYIYLCFQLYLGIIFQRNSWIRKTECFCQHFFLIQIHCY